MRLTIRLLNVLGGAVFAWGFLRYFQSVILSEGEITRASISMSSFNVAVASAPDRISQDWIKENADIARKQLDHAEAMNSSRSLYLVLAMVGAGLVCLRGREE